MKVIVILLLTANLTVQEIQLPTHGLDCFQLGNAWREANTTHRGAGSDQGNYLPNGNLMFAYYCE